MSNYTVIQTDAGLQFYAVEVYDGMLFAAGGAPWQRGDIAVSQDGRDWEVSYLGNRGVFDLHATADVILAVGNDGYVYQGMDQDLDLLTPQHTNMLRAITDVPDAYVMVGGKDWNKGWLYKVDKEGVIIAEHIIEHQLSDVKCDIVGNCVATGYGIIMRSTDFGLSWVRDGQIGDFYRSIAYSAQGTAYVVGHRGSLLYREVDAPGWTSIADGHSPIGKNVPFRKIKFFDEQGYIVGDNGTIWRSDDDGQSWEDISIQTDLDLFDFVIYNGKLILASESGKILTVAI